VNKNFAILVISILAAVLLYEYAALASSWNHLQEEKRAFVAGRQLRAFYVRTPSEKLKIASAYAQTDGTICVELTSEGPNPALIEYDWAIAHRDGRIEYNQDEFAERCQGADAGANLLPTVEKAAR
jgi:hypothetical protein